MRTPNIGVFPKLVYSVLFGSFVIAAVSVQAEDYKGADEVLRIASEALPGQKQETKDPFAAFREKLKEFGESVSNRPPEEVAKGWLALIDDYDVESAERVRGNALVRPVQFEEVMKVLPEPTVWPALEKEIEARAATNKVETARMVGLRLIAHTLTKNAAKRAEDMKALDRVAKTSSTGYGFAYELQQLNEAILATMDNPDAILHMLDAQLGGSSDFSMPLRIPNLVPLIGAEKAEAFLRKALAGSRTLEIDANTPTHKLALKLGLETVGEMKVPQWGLVESLDAVELYEAMDRKFGTAKTNNESAQSEFFNVSRNENGFGSGNAKLYYFLGLIARNRTTDAINVTKHFDRNSGAYFASDIVKQMERAGLTQQLNVFFAGLLKDNPECSFWSEYVQVAAHSGHADEALQLVRTTLQHGDLSQRSRQQLTALLPTALLANDEVDEAVKELRHNFTNSTAPTAGYVDEDAQPALRLATLGKLLNRSDWLEEGLNQARKRMTNESESQTRIYYASHLAQMLSSLDRGPEAEDVLAVCLRNAVQSSGQRANSFDGMEGSSAAAILAELVRVYHHAGRSEDVLRLVDESPDWGASDLIQADRLTQYDLFEEGSGHHRGLPVSYYVASALLKGGRKAEAMKIVDHLLEDHGGSDRLYELLLQVEATNPIPKLEAIYAKDRFEERPLIWEAHWLRTQGRLDEAEAAARKAISIDPSDGEEGPGDRMRAYAELAEIRAARNDDKEATFFRGVVAAIRESEQADRFHSAGLLKRAVKMYEDALNHFADAYCIQSRLAIQLADLGMHEQAEEHYRRAYELMPDSFGRIESHCFGCERAFDGEKAQGIAEKVFTQLAQKTSPKPQVFYLLGYLRDEQERPKDAVDQYRQAVKLDPDYLNAWLKLSENGAKVFLPENERDEIVFNLIRLDPHHRHSRFNVSYVADLAALWQDAAANTDLQHAHKLRSLYPLPASKRKLEEKGNDPMRQRLEMMRHYEEGEDEDGSPAGLVSQNAFIRVGMVLVGRSE